MPLGTIATVQNLNKKKKEKKKTKTKWLTKMEQQMNSKKSCMNCAKILQKKEHKSMTGEK